MADKFNINPDRDKPWNDLPDLPLHESYYKDLQVYDQLVNAKAALARLHGRAIAIPNPGILVNTISLQEAKASSEIENIFTTDDELYQAYSEEKEESYVKGPAKEVLCYREALWEGHKFLEHSKRFSLEYFISLYQIIKQTSDRLRPEYARIYIKQGGSGPNAGKAIYTPPKGKKILEAKLENLIEFVNDDEKYPADPLIKMAIAHYQFEAIHPFRDGKGRAGRIFNIHILTQKELLDLPLLYLSRYIIENKSTYYSLLAGVSQRALWKEYLLYMLKAIEVTSNLTFDKINQILSAREGIENEIIRHTKIRKPEQLVQMLFSQPLTKVSHLTNQKIYAENTARNYLNLLSEMNIVEKKTISGHHYYMNLELYRILAE